VSADRPIVTMVRRKGDPTAPTISDIVYGALRVVVLERPRAPLAKDYAHDGQRMTHAGHASPADAPRAARGAGTPLPGWRALPVLEQVSIPHVLARYERDRVYCACGWSWAPTGAVTCTPEALRGLQLRQLQRHLKEARR
jgi:hypothetical protein